MTQPSLSDIDTLMLDIDGTLLDLRFDNHFWVDHLPARYYQVHGGAEDAVQQYIEETMHLAAGTMNWYCIDPWSNYFDLDIMQLKKEVAHLIKYHAGSLAFLVAIAELEHLQVLLVTDAHPRVLELKHEITGVSDHVPDVYCSHDFGAPKQHADFWSGLASAVPFNPARTLMIDDSINVLRQAQAYGIGQTIYIEQPDSGRIRDNDHLRSEQFPSLNDLSSLVAS